MIGSRSRSREIALQVLYACDGTAAPPPELWQDTLEDAEAGPEVKAFARELVEGVLSQRGEIDRLISRAAENWELGRLAAVDRNVLRLAVHELMAHSEIPAKVSINEAIELGKRYSTAQSGAFVNGLLDRIRRDLGREIEGGEAAGAALEQVEESVTPIVPQPGAEDPAGGSPDSSAQQGS